MWWNKKKISDNNNKKFKYNRQYNIIFSVSSFNIHIVNKKYIKPHCSMYKDELNIYYYLLYTCILYFAYNFDVITYLYNIHIAAFQSLLYTIIYFLNIYHINTYYKYI